MSLTIHQRKKPYGYLKLILEFLLKPIRSAAKLAQAHNMINSLLDKEQLSDGERDYLQVLSQLAEEFEDKAYPMDTVS